MPITLRRIPLWAFACLVMLIVVARVSDVANGQAPSARPASAPLIDVSVTEGTSMSVAVSPDGRTLAIDLQGSLWTLPQEIAHRRREQL